MRVLRTIGMAFLLAGALCIVAGSGAFDGVAADRGTAVETVPDESAYVGVDYPAADQSRTVRLRSENADGGGGVFLRDLPQLPLRRCGGRPVF
ncbi:hypothetical protein G9464_13585 [Halostella sp. JP-L12]|uniref:hypothetical protein n=1 Tax=Halostella TaxID=1843185 RepID=UPI0013CEC642|nr:MULTISPECIES: hypothetical protein [Halostella]NHN48619.1 hypothetical protein [Halostella sp. JP-L12]